MKLKKGDQVVIISGKDRGKRGKILDVFPSEARVVVEGVNIRKKHVRPKKSGEKGQVVQTPAPLAVSNLKLICPKCGQPTKVGYKVVEDKKYRLCKKCGQEI
jgi:large subunit ribosomal protein L24